MPGVYDDVVFNKTSVIKRCIDRIKEEYRLNPSLDNLTHVDALTLNIERACQATIDLAMHIVAKEKFGIPQSSADAFVLLEQNKRIDTKLSKEMVQMVGFRNIIIHEYQKLDTEILKNIAENDYKSFIHFVESLGYKI